MSKNLKIGTRTGRNSAGSVQRFVRALPRSPLDALYDNEPLPTEPEQPQPKIEYEEIPPSFFAEQKEAEHFWGRHPKRKWLNGINTKLFVSSFVNKISPELSGHEEKLESLFSAALTYCEEKLDEIRKETRVCPKCKTEKPMDSFRAKPTWCKTCLGERERKQRSSVADKIRRTNYQRDYMRRYRAANPEREAKTVLKALAKKPEMLMTQYRGMVSLNESYENGRPIDRALASDLPPDEAMMLAEEMEGSNDGAEARDL